MTPPRAIACALVFLLLAILMVALSAPSLLASDPCNSPSILSQSVCDFDTWHGESPRQVADGWREFVISGNPEFFSSDHASCWGGNTQAIRSGSPFVAGILTEVNVTPGAGYRASLSWGAPNLPDEFGRTLGIDPTGGTDPAARSVVWGPTHYGAGRILNYPPPDVNIDVRARAIGSRLTVFFRVDRPTSSGDGLIFIDTLALYPDESAPFITPGATTPATPQQTPEETPEATETQTPEATPTATPTFTPTWTPDAPPWTIGPGTPVPSPVMLVPVLMERLAAEGVPGEP